MHYFKWKLWLVSNLLWLIVARTVTDIRNVSVSLIKFPTAFKLAKVEKDWKTNVSNYQPISLLSIISKVIEKVVHQQTIKFLNNSIQHVLWISIWLLWISIYHSADLFLSFLNDKILKHFDNGMYADMILIN